MSTTAAIILVFAIGSVALFSSLFVVVIFRMRNRWEEIGDPTKRPGDSPKE